MKIELVQEDDKNALAELRLLAMRESLEAVGRFDPARARERFLSAFVAANTKKVIVSERLVGFYVVIEHSDHLYLDHLYVHPEHQGAGLGSQLLTAIISQASKVGKTIRLGALKESRSNDFYLAHGFVKTGEGPFDNYYECVIN